MRILHICDQAGVACTLSKYQNLAGHESKVLVLAGVDRFGIYEFYKKYCTEIEELDFIKTCLAQADSADIVHIHSRSDIFLKIYQKYRTSKKIILHYHGTDVRGLKSDNLQYLDPARRILARSRRQIVKIRNKWRLLSLGYLYSAHKEAQKISKVTVVSTPDLLSLVSNAIYIPNPVDTDHFKPNTSVNKIKKAVTINTEVTDTEWVLRYCKSNNINLEIEVYDRTVNPIMFKEMPQMLNSFEIYVDIRYVNNNILNNLSKTALEALACGLHVLDYQLIYRRSLPVDHSPFKAVSELLKLYSK